jgi:hypothetical protein
MALSQADQTIPSVFNCPGKRQAALKDELTQCKHKQTRHNLPANTSAGSMCALLSRNARLAMAGPSLAR